MEWIVKLEAKTGWGEGETIEVGRLERRVVGLTAEEVGLNGEKFRPVVARLLWNCDDLRRYLANNTGSLIDHGERYRSKLPISTSRAEGCVDEIANARMAKKQRMRWSPRGAHRLRSSALPCWTAASEHH